MTEIQKIIDLLLPELLQQLDNENSSDLSQKGLDKGNNSQAVWGGGGAKASQPRTVVAIIPSSPEAKPKKKPARFIQMQQSY